MKSRLFALSRVVSFTGILLVAFLTLASTSGTPTYSDLGSIQTSDKASWRSVRYDQRLGNQIPLQTSWTTESGKAASLSSLLSNKPHILVFAYYRCPNLCTLVLNGLAETLQKLPQRLGKDYDVFTVSIDPSETHTLALMKKRTYLARLGTPDAEGWSFLVGKNEAIHALTQEAGFYYEKDKLSGEYSHPSGIIVLTREGKISQYLFGIKFDPKQLDQALGQAAQNKRGSLVEEVLLYCFHYDPAAHSNGKAIMAMIRLLGLIGAFALAGLIIHLSISKKPLPKKDTLA